MSSQQALDAAALSARIIGLLTARHQTIAVAESLTGGLLVAELIRTPGASAVVSGGVVAYNTELKHTVLGVNAEILALHGAVHPDVAAQMAVGVRLHLAVAGLPAHIGISTTGVAGPDPQDGQAVGTVYLGFAIGSDVRTRHLQLSGGREAIREAVVYESLRELEALLLQSRE
ncbi:nicotinamide-nucleotide amidase [Salinibacterium sp. CAN_S4]|uniref:CinA family protein n=1 Tax=Salinibacterium sp. CAN_S4 TaxID=2787727 RepID=UPI0018EFC062